jgi:hypothetical protein
MHQEMHGRMATGVDFWEQCLTKLLVLTAVTLALLSPKTAILLGDAVTLGVLLVHLRHSTLTIRSKKLPDFFTFAASVPRSFGERYPEFLRTQQPKRDSCVTTRLDRAQ